MSWLLTLLVVAGAVALGRIYYGIRKMKEKTEKDWDARLIEKLRASGSDPFQPHEVDFFMAMPSEAAGHAVAAILEAEGYRVDVKPAPENPGAHPFSLHATRSLRLSVPGMRELTSRFQKLAKAHGGHYDGWSAAVVPHGGGQQS
ncbi:MAG TPA: ribonuclease E inhibitor RraB [Steroidobacteraceae bacterium]|nr:ribonuclease E inhibitor RraB [Steroidobacteraceae bacterium]